MPYPGHGYLFLSLMNSVICKTCFLGQPLHSTIFHSFNDILYLLTFYHSYDATLTYKNFCYIQGFLAQICIYRLITTVTDKPKILLLTCNCNCALDSKALAWRLRVIFSLHSYLKLGHNTIMKNCLR